MSKFNRDSNVYIWIFAFIMTITLGGVLASVQDALAPLQKAERELESKKFILSSALGADYVGQLSREEVVSVYDKRVKSFVVNTKGEIQPGMSAKDVNVRKEYKDKKKNNPLDRLLPVYTIDKQDSEEVEFYVFQIHGKGLWDEIWGYMALESDLATVKGVVFDHKGETPGLGARITSADIQTRYNGKKIFDANNQLAPVVMAKGEGNNYDDNPHKVDGMSGATFTAIGLNNMQIDYLNMYLAYINSQKKK